jgi:hypothetical protein
VENAAQDRGGRRAAAKMTRWIETHAWLWRVLLVVYYLAVIAGLIAIYGRGDFSPPPFIYQAF